jgi:hypothetical protein
MADQNNILYSQHYLGITLLLLNIIILFKFHQLGIILFGFILVAGMLTLVSFDVGLRVDSFFITAAKIPVFWGNAMCLLWLIIHLIFSFRYYVGILTRDYWQKLWASASKKLNASSSEQPNI